MDTSLLNTDYSIYTQWHGENGFRMPFKSHIEMVVNLTGSTTAQTSSSPGEFLRQQYRFKAFVKNNVLFTEATQISSSASAGFTTGTGTSLTIINSGFPPYTERLYMFRLIIPSTLADANFTLEQVITTSFFNQVTLAYIPITPSNISNGLKAWFDVSNQTKFTTTGNLVSGSEISQLGDVWQSDDNMVQTISLYKPKFYGGGAFTQLGLAYTPHLSFDGSSSCLQNSSDAMKNIGAGAWTMIVVFKSNKTSQETYGQVVMGTNSPVPQCGIAINQSSTYGGGGSDSIGVFCSSTPYLNNALQCNITSASVMSPKIVIGRREGSTIDVIDESGRNASLTNVNAVKSTANTDFFTLGGRWRTTVDFNEFQGSIFEAVVYTRKITDTERSQLMEYLKEKWNIISNA